MELHSLWNSTRAQVSVVSEETFRRTFPSCRLERSSVMLKGYTGELSPVQGSLPATVRLGNHECRDVLYVVPGHCPSLMGRDWMKGLGIELRNVMDVKAVTSVEGLVAEYASVFDDALGAFKGVSAKIIIEDNVKPRFFKARPVPFAMIDRVNEELMRMERVGVMRPIKTSEWAAPIVPILKRIGQIRICGDFKVTLNPVTVPEKYPIPRVEDMFSRLSGGEKFSKLNLKDAYLQVQLDEASRKLVTINTPKGLGRWENLLQGLTHVVVYFDDVLVAGRDDQDHLTNLGLVLSRLKQAGLKLKLDKCTFLERQVQYLGHVVTAAGFQPNPEKVEAVLKAPRPKDVKALQSYLGLVNFYRTFLPGLSSVLHPLNELLVAKVPWEWREDHERAFQRSKELLVSAAVLAHYDPKKPVVLVCDASPYGVGAVLAYREDSGAERPIAFASRSLATAERNYSHLDKQALALMFGVTKFRKCVWGREFEAITDHKPLLGLLAPDKRVPEMRSPRIMRWALMFGAYNYKLMYRPGASIANADGLSRLPLPVYAQPVERPAEVFMLEAAYPQVLWSTVVVEATSKDSTLAKLRDALWSGAELRDPEFRFYTDRKLQLSVQEDCILLGSRVIISSALQQEVLRLLHEGHPGMTKMKAIARSHVWWTWLEEDVTAAVRQCQVSQEHQRVARPVAMMPWPFPDRPWSRLHIDFAAPLKNSYLLVVIDAFSKWIEAVPISTPSAEATISCLRVMFATHGLPDVVVSDNGPAFDYSPRNYRVLTSGADHGPIGPLFKVTPPPPLTLVRL
ncbi:uncharacterized protein K02A2.6-like [Dermacentor silvarum]|uniref:uncharacterized protein K02A2.6-like n=1 Tax=Dermacentor silvarum TaxID=543639 RepID=UPI00189BF2C9|nr:uncharacterized protein K02A2.6-like [Dermacentor silvarum]